MTYKRYIFQLEVVAVVILAFVWSTTAETGNQNTATTSMKVDGNNTITVNRYKPVTMTCNGALMETKNVITSIDQTGEKYELDCSASPTAIYNKTLLGFIPPVSEVFFAEVCVSVQIASKSNTSYPSSGKGPNLMGIHQYKRRLVELGHSKRLMYEVKDYVVVGVLTGGVGAGVMAAADYFLTGKSNEELTDDALAALVEQQHATNTITDTLSRRADAIEGAVIKNNELIANMEKQVDDIQSATQFAVEKLTESLKSTNNYITTGFEAMDKAHKDNLLLVYNDLVTVIKNNTDTQIEFNSWVQTQIYAATIGINKNAADILELTRKNKLRLALTNTIRSVITIIEEAKLVPLLTTSDRKFMSEWGARSTPDWKKKVGSRYQVIYSEISGNSITAFDIQLVCDIMVLNGDVPSDLSWEELIAMLSTQKPENGRACGFDVSPVYTCMIRGMKANATCAGKGNSLSCLLDDWISRVSTPDVPGVCEPTNNMNVEVGMKKAETKEDIKFATIQALLDIMNTRIFAQLKNISTFNSDVKVVLRNAHGVFTSIITDNTVFFSDKPTWLYIQHTKYGKATILGKLAQTWVLDLMLFAPIMDTHKNDMFGLIPTTVTLKHMGLTQMENEATADCWVATVIGVPDVSKTPWEPVYELTALSMRWTHTLQYNPVNGKNIKTYVTDLPMDGKDDGWDNLPVTGDVVVGKLGRKQFFNTKFDQHSYLLHEPVHSRANSLLYLLVRPSHIDCDSQKTKDCTGKLIDSWFTSNPGAVFDANAIGESLIFKYRHTSAAPCDAVDMRRYATVCRLMNTWTPNELGLGLESTNDNLLCLQKKKWSSTTEVRHTGGDPIQLVVERSCPTVTLGKSIGTGVPPDVLLLLAINGDKESDTEWADENVASTYKVRWKLCRILVPRLEDSCKDDTVESAFVYSQPVLLYPNITTPVSIWNAIPYSNPVSISDIQSMTIAVQVFRNTATSHGYTHNCYSEVISNAMGTDGRVVDTTRVYKATTVLPDYNVDGTYQSSDFSVNRTLQIISSIRGDGLTETSLKFGLVHSKADIYDRLMHSNSKLNQQLKQFKDNNTNTINTNLGAITAVFDDIIPLSKSSTQNQLQEEFAVFARKSQDAGITTNDLLAMQQLKLLELDEIIKQLQETTTTVGGDGWFSDLGFPDWIGDTLSGIEDILVISAIIGLCVFFLWLACKCCC
jgi:hypothetical protein